MCCVNAIVALSRHLCKRRIGLRFWVEKVSPQPLHYTTICSSPGSVQLAWKSFSLHSNGTLCTTCRVMCSCWGKRKDINVEYTLRQAGACIKTPQVRSHVATLWRGMSSRASDRVSFVSVLQLSRAAKFTKPFLRVIMV